MDNKIEHAYEAPLEDLRLQALIHYDEAASAIHHYSSFVKDAILAYTPPKYKELANPNSPLVTFSQPVEEQKETDFEKVAKDMNHLLRRIEALEAFQQRVERVPVDGLFVFKEIDEDENKPDYDND